MESRLVTSVPQASPGIQLPVVSRLSMLTMFAQELKAMGERGSLELQLLDRLLFSMKDQLGLSDLEIDRILGVALPAFDDASGRKAKVVPLNTQRPRTPFR